MQYLITAPYGRTSVLCTMLNGKYFLDENVRSLSLYPSLLYDPLNPMDYSAELDVKEFNLEAVPNRTWHS